MMQVAGNSPLEAWRAGAEAVLDAGELTNLVTTIADPCRLEDQWLSDYSPDQLDTKFDDIRDVVNTIFPLKLSRKYEDRADFYAQYLARHDRARRMRRGKRLWGTYFERLVRFPGSDVNQLERVIGKLESWRVRSATALVFHLSSPTVDSPRTRGGPCWQFGELLWDIEDRLSLVAVYRNHDFLNKTLGNFLGLGQLLRFICDHAKKEPARLICHSVHAYTEGPKSALRKLVLAPDER